MSEISNNYVSSRQQTNIYSSNHQLIILGNGFDLECGLHSRFSDFMKYRPWTMMREALRNATPTENSAVAENVSKTDYDKICSAIEQLQQALDEMYAVRKATIDAEYKTNEAYDKHDEYIANSGNITFDESLSTDFEESVRTLRKMKKQEREIKHKVWESSEKLLDIFDALVTNNNCLCNVRDMLKASYAEIFGQSNDNLDPAAYYRSGKTVWDIILQANSQKTWYNIEAEIKKWMTVSEKSTPAPYSKVADKINTEIIPTDNYLPIIVRSSSSLPITQVAYFLHSLLGDQRSWTPKDVSSLLMQELHRFESAFCQYLNYEMKNHENYYKKSAEELLSRIIQLGLPNNYKTEVSILDFNFTDPLDENDKISISNNIEVDPVVVNIHGSYKNSTAIFGIDGTDNMEEENSRHFTKTYRLLSLSNPNIRSVIHAHHENRNDNSLPDMIKFYGHSLSEADYSYFQSIFDGINLYEGNTRLIFFYRPRRDNTAVEGARIPDNDAANEMKDKVTKLLLTYGNTLTNKDHGKNLIHKLILEGRLNVLPI